jgi:integrase
MASIFRRPDSQCWFAAYRAADGRRVKVTTKTDDKDEAQRIADRLELDVREARDKRKATASLNGVNDTIQRATQLAVAGRLDAHAARDLVNDLLAAAGQESLDTMTNRAWCDNWRKSKAGAVKERSRMKYEQVSRNWLAFLNGKANKPLEAIGKADAIAYRDRLANEGLAARTVNQTVKLLRGIYSEAVEQGHIGRNPFAGVDRLREDVDDGRRMPFTETEVAALICAAKGDWKGLIILAATSGLRLMDAARLDWRNLDLDASLLRIKTAKTGAALTLPLHSAFIAWLKDQPRGIGAAPVFPTLADKGGAGKSGLSMAFKRLMDRAEVSAGVARQAKDKSRGRTTSQKSFHSLRHFAATQLATNGVRAEIARAITGHADADTHANYITADIESLRAAVGNIRLTA